MMDNKGFSLIELMVVVSIVGVLSLALGTSFQGSMAANRVEGQIKELYSDMMRARALAMQRNRIYFVAIDPAAAPDPNYQITEDTNRDGVLNVAAGDTDLFPTPKLFSDPVIWGGGTIQLNTNGTIGTLGVIELVKDMSTSTIPDYNCIELLGTRIKTGRMNGGNCDVR